MEIVLDVLRIVVVLSAAIVAGGQIFCLRAVLPAMPEWPAEMSARVHQDALTDRPHTYLRATSSVTIVSGLALLILLFVSRSRGEQPAAELAFTFLGWLITLASAAISSREWPINHEINSWGAHPQLERYAELRRLWDSRHVKRTWLSSAALLCFVAALVAPSP